MSLLGYQQTKILSLENKLRCSIYGQDKVIKSLVDTIKVNFAGLSDEDKPIGSFLFTGSTGVGKTELAIELAKALDMNFERFDMSEYAQDNTVNNLFGSPKGFNGHDEGGLLTNAIQENPHSVVLFDEVEKADKKIFNTFLQILDYGTLRDSRGFKVDFSKTIVIFTSNLGAENKTVGFAKNNSQNTSSNLRQFFSPEFLSRLDNILTFNSLDEKMMNFIIIKQLHSLSEKLKESNIRITYHKSLIELFMQKGLYQNKGARGIKKIIDLDVKVPIANYLLQDELTDIHLYVYSISGNIQINFNYSQYMSKIDNTISLYT